jgi:hypothetical protein
MEQRPLRLGDILDDYCTRERRVTNHAVVAMIEDTVKQTRCTTCDAEHPYKGGQAPRRRKKGTVAAAPVLTETETHLPSALATADTPDDNLQHSDNGLDGAPLLVPGEVPLDEPLQVEAAAEEAVAEAEDVHDESFVDQPADVQHESMDNEFDDDRQPDMPEVEGPVHRRLIRATLPRPEGQKDERRPPDFTIRQNGGRGNVAAPSFRGGNKPRVNVRGSGGSGAPHGGNGHRPSGGARFSGARPGQGQGRGQGGGFRSAQPPRHGGGGGGRKRSR